MTKKILICGGRKFTDYQFLCQTLDRELAEFLPDVEIIHGAQRGADSLAWSWAINRKIPRDRIKPFPANWKEFGMSAGPRRNTEMLEYGIDLVIAFHGQSGTEDMIAQAETRGVEVRRIEFPEADAIHYPPEGEKADTISA